MDSSQTFVEAVKQVVKDEYPDLVSGFHYPVKARVLSVQNGLAVVQILNTEDQPDKDRPPIPALRIPATISELNQGDLVRLGFYYNDPLKGFIEDMA